jgi:hypothetical protein
MTSKWMSALDDPVDVVGDVGEERTLIGFKVVENISNLRKS